MPKPTPSQAKEGAFGIQEGQVRIEDACFRTYQMSQNKKTGDTYAPFPALLLKLVRLNEDGDPEGEPDEQPFGCGKIDKFAPTDDPHFETPVDDYREPGAEGRYIMSLADGVDFNKSSKYIQFNEALIVKGFHSSLLDECDSRVYIGLEGHIKQDMKKGSDGREYKVTVFDKITKFPYDTKKKTGKKPVEEDEEETPKASAKKKTNSGFDADAAAQKILAGAIKKYRKNDEEVIPFSSLRKAVNTAMLDDDPDHRDAVAEKIGDVDWLKEVADDLGFEVKKSSIELGAV